MRTDIVARVRTLLDEEDGLKTACEVLRRERGYFWIGFYGRVGDELVRLAFAGPIPPCHAFALDEGNVGRTGRLGVKKVVPDVTQDKDYKQCFLATRSEVVIPVKDQGKVIGVLDVESDRPDAFDAAEVHLLEQVADAAALAVSES
jgi:GAF domain-containing protein